MSLLTATRWVDGDLAPELRRSAALLVGLLHEAGWLKGAEIVTRADVIYLLFEKPWGDAKRYVELIVSTGVPAASALLDESDGRIVRSGQVPTATRFLVIDARDITSDGVILSVEDFIDRFTGLERRAHPAAPALDGLAAEVATTFEAGHGNVLIYGRAGTGKSAALRALQTSGWSDHPGRIFVVDLADGGPADPQEAIDRVFQEAFPPHLKVHAGAIGTYLVRTGRAALFIDSLELLGNGADPRTSARSLAGLCRYLSHDSVVVMAGRDAALRDSAVVREFLLGSTPTSDQLGKALSAFGIDAGSLPGSGWSAPGRGVVRPSTRPSTASRRFSVTTSGRRTSPGLHVVWETSYRSHRSRRRSTRPAN